jgi:hypothetical protein
VALARYSWPPGGEVPEDYSFDCIGADGAPSTVRLSQLFRGGDLPPSREALADRRSLIPPSRDALRET